jgi:hypothetical protein
MGKLAVLRRWLVAVAIAVAAVVATGMPAQAALPPYLVKYLPTQYCLWSLYDHSVSTTPCTDGLLWQETYLSSAGYYLYQNTVTKECLSNADYFTAFTAPCNASEPGQWWLLTPGLQLLNANTGRYLYSDYSGRVSLTGYIADAQWADINPD